MSDLRDKAARYSTAFSGGPGVLADKDDRLRKARKVRSVLEDEGVLPNRALRVLDVGCSHGLMLSGLAPYVGYCVGLDMDTFAGSPPESNIAFIRGDAERLPFSNESFDVVVCNHVYEHTENANSLIGEIERVLKPSGVCYFAGPNKFDLIEPHYRLPLLSWLPRPIANMYVRLMKRGSGYPEKPLSWFALRKLLSRFDVRYYSPDVVQDPTRYATEDLLRPGGVKHFIARVIVKIAPFLFPTHVVLLRKRKAPSLLPR